MILKREILSCVESIRQELDSLILFHQNNKGASNAQTVEGLVVSIAQFDKTLSN